MKFPKIGTPPPKFLLWFTLGFFSSSMAEVLSSSHPQGIFDLWGIMVIFPLYTLHILVLSGILFKIGINWQRLFLFGCVFGMYEGYITKVFWDPFWGPEEIEVLGVYWFQFSTLVFFWHAFFAFILPLLVVERFFTSSSFVLDSVKKFPLLNKLSRRTAVLPPHLRLGAILEHFCGNHNNLRSCKPNNLSRDNAPIQKTLQKPNVQH